MGLYFSSVYDTFLFCVIFSIEILGTNPLVYPVAALNEMTRKRSTSFQRLQLTHALVWVSSFQALQKELHMTD